MSHDSDAKTVRYQFEFTQRMSRDIELFEKESGMTTHREFFANALALWRWAAQKSREGKRIAAIEKEGDQLSYIELALPALDEVREGGLAAKILDSQPGIRAPSQNIDKHGIHQPT